MKPIVRLLAVLLVGAAVGLIYGWVVQPVRYVDTAPGSLRADYRTDYVLMVAQAYTAEQDLLTAQVRLASLGPQPPADLVTSALTYAVDHGFTRADLETLNQLAVALRSAAPAAEIQAP
ncbi:MAG: hypothetical protein FJZ97_12885 [Chloroflexi bacterium]|nr:hypothetical protein [Chloroflexota bacterium]